MLLGIKKGHLKHPMSTVYIMLGKRCHSNCSYCTQARTAVRYTNKLSRVTWPPVESGILLKSLRGCRELKRVCIQTLDYPDVVEDLCKMAWMIQEASREDVKLSASLTPVSRSHLEELKEAGFDTISIALDAANEDLFDLVRGKIRGNRFTWYDSLRAIDDAKDVFGWTYTHIIVGMGESDRDLYNIIKYMKDRGVGTALFAYTPVPMDKAQIKGSPDIVRYHAFQLMRHLMYMEVSGFEPEFSERGELVSLGIGYERLIEHIDTWHIPQAFMTSGCPHCTRPYYNERPQGPLYNYPYIPGRDIAKEIVESMKDRGVI